MIMKYLLFTCLIIGSAVAQEDNVREALDSLPAEFQGKVSEEQVNDAKNKSLQVLKQLCDKNGGNDAFDNVVNEFKTFTSCIQELVDQSVIQKEIEDAKTNGTVDEVFKKYCDKTPSFKQCFYQLADTAKKCVGDTEKANLKTVYNVTEQLAQFVCFKNGDRIALFIAEGGPECFKSKQEGIQTCLNETLGSDLKDVNTNELSADTINELPTLTFDEGQCKKLTLLQKCVVAQLETCEQPTSANIVESLFKFARKATPCKKFPEQADRKSKSHNNVDPSETKVNSAPMLATTSALLLVLASALV